MTTSLWQQLAVRQCTCCTLQTKKSSHLSLPKLGLRHQTPISPLSLLPTCSTFWMISLVSLTLPKLQTVLCSPLAEAASLYIIQVYFHYRELMHHFAEWHMQVL